MCGDNYLGNVRNCTSGAAVTATGDKSGGICGQNNSGTVTDCRNTGTVSGISYTGGICGYNTKEKNSATAAQISNCTNIGNVTGTGNYIGGVCGYNDPGCTIQNSHSTNATVTGSNNSEASVGGICGYNKGEITGCTASGSVSSTSTSDSAYAGGICGQNSAGTVQGCTSACTVTGTGRVNYTGGICGYNKTGSVLDCHNTGAVNGNEYVGGVCGYNKGSILKECSNTGNVTGTGSNTGGVCGCNEGSTLKECYNAGEVNGTGYNTGGVCGKNNSGAIVQDCYNTNRVTGSTIIGGICGQNVSASTVTRCYNIGEGCENAICDVGNSTDCYYLSDTSGTITNGSTSATAAEFKSGKVAYQLQEAVGKAAKADGKTPPDTWGQTIGKNESPVLKWQTEDYQKVYPTADNSPCKRYSNTENGKQEHEYVNGECIYCGDKKAQPTYTVTIPATVELGNAASAKADITAQGVTLPADKTLKVTINGINDINGTNGIDSTNDINGTNGSNGVFTATLDGTSETVSYTIKNGTTELTPGETVLTAASGENSKTTTLTFFKPDNAPYAGSYTGTVTFTVSVVETTH